MRNLHGETDVPAPTKINRLKYSGYSAEFLDRVEPNGNILNKEIVGWERLNGGCAKSDSWDASQRGQQQQQPRPFPCSASSSAGSRGCNNSDLNRQMSVASDSKLLEDEINNELRVMLRPKRPPRPQSEAFLDQVADNKRKSKRYSAFGVSSTFFLPIRLFLSGFSFEIRGSFCCTLFIWRSGKSVKSLTAHKSVYTVHP